MRSHGVPPRSISPEIATPSLFHHASSVANNSLCGISESLLCKKTNGDRNNARSLISAHVRRSILAGQVAEDLLFSVFSVSSVAKPLSSFNHKKIRATRFNPRRPLLIDSRSCRFSLPFTRSRFGFTLAAPGEFHREAPLWDSPHDLGSVLPRPHHLKVPQSLTLPLSFASTRFYPCCREPRREAFPPPTGREHSRFYPRRP